MMILFINQIYTIIGIICKKENKTYSNYKNNVIQSNDKFFTKSIQKTVILASMKQVYFNNIKLLLICKINIVMKNNLNKIRY